MHEAGSEGCRRAEATDGDRFSISRRFPFPSRERRLRSKKKKLLLENEANSHESMTFCSPLQRERLFFGKEQNNCGDDEEDDEDEDEEDHKIGGKPSNL